MGTRSLRVDGVVALRSVDNSTRRISSLLSIQTSIMNREVRPWSAARSPPWRSGDGGEGPPPSEGHRHGRAKGGPRLLRRLFQVAGGPGDQEGGGPPER